MENTEAEQDAGARALPPTTLLAQHTPTSTTYCIRASRLQYLCVTSHAQCPPSHAVESGGILGGAPPSLLRTQRAALMRVRTSLKSSRAGSETISARASCARGATVRATARGRPVRLALAQALA